MKYIEGQNRNQLTIFPVSLDDSIDKDNEVRIIDMFVNSFDMSEMGFRNDFIEIGRPAYYTIKKQSTRYNAVLESSLISKC